MRLLYFLAHNQQNCAQYIPCEVNVDKTDNVSKTIEHETSIE
jgi:hypothetical protein